MAEVKENDRKLNDQARQKPERDTPRFYVQEADQVLQELEVNPDEGLSDDEASKRKEKYGENKIPAKERTSVIKLFLKQFKDFLILILLIAAAISLYIGHMADVYIILAVILFNAIMGFIQEYKAEKAIEAIKSMVEHNALVIRNGQKQTLEATALVPGDILVLEEGQTVPADARLIQAKNLQAAEASLTGESEAVTKQPDPLEEDTVLADRVNMVWKSTHIVKGSGLAVVTATGKHSEIGKIAHTLGEMKKTESNFRRKTGRLAKIMAFIAIGTSALVFCIGYFYRSYEFQDILMVTIATLVSSIPEGLPVVISIVLAIGASRMAKRNAIVREFTATEELGSVTTIMSDKTGTITQGVLSVRKVTGADGQEWEVTGHGYQLNGKLKKENKDVEVTKEDKVLSKILMIAAYCNKATIKNNESPEQDTGNKDDEDNGEDSDRSADPDAQSQHATPAVSRRVKESRRRITEDLRRLEEDIRNSPSPDEREHREMIQESRAQLDDTLERWEDDVAREASQKKPDPSGRNENRSRPDESDKDAEVQVTGDTTEVALLVLAKKSRIKEREPFNAVEVIDDLPFNSEQKYRATLIRHNNKREMLVVGAPEKMLELSTAIYSEDGPKKAGNKEKESIQQKHDRWAEEAMRIIALAHKEMPDNKNEIKEEDVKDLVWTGMVGIIDPPRTEVKEAIEACHHAGIRVIMVTGDHKKTAAAIARQVGIVKPNGKESKYPVAVSEHDIADLGDQEFDDMIKNVSVFARVSPDSKLRIAERLHSKGELIAMTGDGVNDALALKKADVGIAMGKKGTDVAKDAAQIVLSDDNFASIVNAIREGRIIFVNVKIVSYFLLTTNMAATATIVVALVIGMPIPLTAVQILWVNMVTDGVMDVGLATEPGHGEIMEREPIKKNESILKWEVMPNLLTVAAIMVAMTIVTFNYYLPQGEDMARTGSFLVISMTQIFNVFNMRDLKESVFKIGMFSNKWINLAFAASILMQILAIKLPFLRQLFDFEDISMLEIATITVASTVVLWTGELVKLIQRKRRSSSGRHK